MRTLQLMLYALALADFTYVALANQDADANGEAISNTSEANETEDAEIKNLSQIDYIIRPNSTVDISLSKVDYEESCYLLTNNEDKVNSNLPGITFQGTSVFVSCRVTIGPLFDETSIVGNWTLCGVELNPDVEHAGKVRCQPTTIQQRSFNNARIQNAFSHPVSLGYTITPGVGNFGNIQTCHIITPYGEDLVLTRDSEYPNLTLVSGRQCDVQIGPVDMNFLNDWVIYGIFTSIFPTEEVRLPISLFLYDEENPYAQPYNVTNEPQIQHVINIGNTIEAEITGTGTTNKCQLISPSGEKYTKESNLPSAVSFLDIPSGAACRVALRGITEDMLGKWRFSGKFENGGQFTERVQEVQIIKEDPANPIEDPRRTIENQTNIHLNTKMGETHRIALQLFSFTTVESCHIRTPDGLQYNFMIDGFHIPGVETIFNRDSVACGVVITLESENLAGNWTLIARETRFVSDLIEKRQPFTLYVEETATAFPKAVAIAEGNDLYIRLENPIQSNHDCKLVGPNEDDRDIEMDLRFSNYCGFVVHNVNFNDSGTWEIVYGENIVYKAPVEVTVFGRWEANKTDRIWSKDKPVDLHLGPEKAVYCKIEDPNGLVVHEDFGRCRIVLEKALSSHAGLWIMYVGTPGRVTTDEYAFTIEVGVSSPKPTVVTKVQTESSNVMLSCSVASNSTVRACSFRDPAGRTFLANHGVGEDRYTFHGNGVSLHSEVHMHDCGLRITDPEAGDLGLWRCAMETQDDTYYGFMPVSVDWVTHDPTKPVVTEPFLSAEREAIITLEGDSLTMSCSIQSAIEYCYFRAENGTVYNVSPGSSGDVAYAGAGFDAGDCGVRLRSLRTADAGAWSCHVGLPRASAPEQRALIRVAVQKEMTANQLVSDGEVQITANVYQARAIEYCRFVRIDGTGFTSSNVPSGYYTSSESLVTDLSRGQCFLGIEKPTVIDRQPWTVVVKIQGQDREVSRVTEHVLDLPPHVIGNPGSGSMMRTLWLVLIVVGLSLIALGILTVPSRNREWTRRQAISFRNSVRRPRRKELPPVYTVEEKSVIAA